MAEDLTPHTSESTTPNDEEKQLAIELQKANLKKANLECDKLEVEKEKILAEKEKILFDKAEIERIRNIHGFWKTSNWETGWKTIGGVAFAGTLFVMFYKPYSDLREAKANSAIVEKTELLKTLTGKLEDKNDTLKLVNGKLSYLNDSLNTLQSNLIDVKSVLGFLSKEALSLRNQNVLSNNKLKSSQDSLHKIYSKLADTEYELANSVQDHGLDNSNNRAIMRETLFMREFEIVQLLVRIKLDSICLIQEACLIKSSADINDIMMCVEPIFNEVNFRYEQFYIFYNKDYAFNPIAPRIIEAVKDFKVELNHNTKLKDDRLEIIRRVRELISNYTQDISYSTGLTSSDL